MIYKIEIDLRYQRQPTITAVWENEGERRLIGETFGITLKRDAKNITGLQARDIHRIASRLETFLYTCTTRCVLCGEAITNEQMAFAFPSLGFPRHEVCP
jgi:hypothetical protein